MADKCEAVLGGNRCGFNAEWLILVGRRRDHDGNDDFDGTSLACTRHVGTVMEEKDIDRAEVEKL